jgi:hypothetical protein
MRVPQAAGAQMRQLDPQKLPPPVVAYLLSRCRLSPREALVSCLRELAAEGLLRLETDASGAPVISLGADSPRSGRPLLLFECVALDRVRSRAGRLTRVPLSALLANDGDGYQEWARRQADELGQEAARAGLAVKLRLTRRWHLTPAGVAAADWWRRDGRAAPGPARRWDADGPASAPPPRGYVWSSLGGQWRTVRLGRALPPPFWGARSSLGLLVFFTAAGSLYSVMFGYFGDGFDLEGKLLAFTPAALFALVIVTCWLPALSRRLRLPDSVTFTGQVVKQKYVDGGAEDPDRYFVWVDDGSPTTMMFDLVPGNHQRVTAGDLVQVGWSPRQRRLLDIKQLR